MKKVFAVLAIAAAFAACNNATEAEVTVTDSSILNTTIDSAAAVVDSASAAIDSTVKVASAIDAKVDSLKK